MRTILSVIFLAFITNLNAQTTPNFVTKLDSMSRHIAKIDSMLAAIQAQNQTQLLPRIAPPAPKSQIKTIFYSTVSPIAGAWYTNDTSLISGIAIAIELMVAANEFQPWRGKLIKSRDYIPIFLISSRFLQIISGLNR